MIMIIYYNSKCKIYFHLYKSPVKSGATWRETPPTLLLIFIDSNIMS